MTDPTIVERLSCCTFSRSVVSVGPSRNSATAGEFEPALSETGPVESRLLGSKS